MIEILFLVIVVAGLAAQRKTSARLRQLEIEVETLKAALLTADMDMTPATITVPAAAGDTVAILPTPADGNAPDSLAAGEATDDGPWAKARRAAGAIETETAATDVVPDATANTPSVIEPKSRGESFESWLGARWAVWVGGLALALGGIFLVKYSIESGLLSPAVRLLLACLFGLVLVGAGELVRRRGGMPALAGRFEDAMIPGILTAAGAVTLFGAIYAAHGVYGFIGAATAYFALGIVALATLGLSLKHGQALAGLGLLGSMATPMLVASSAPNIWALFGFLTITWVATALASRLKGWLTVPGLASLGLGIWTVFYLEVGTTVDLMPPTLALLVMIAGSLFIWPGRALNNTDEIAATAPTTAVPVSANPIDQPTTPADHPQTLRLGAWLHLLGRPPLALTIALAVATLLPALVMLGVPDTGGGDVQLAFGAIVAALAAFGATRIYAVWPAILSAAAAIGGVGLMATLQVSPIWTTLPSGPAVTISRVNYNGEIAVGLGLGALFVLFGIVFLDQKGRRQPHFSALWSLLMALVPVAIAAISFVNFGRLDRDWLHGTYAVATGLVLLTAAEWTFRRGTSDENGAPEKIWPVNILVTGSFAAFAVALHALTSGLATTVLLSVIGIAFVAATRIRNWAALPWMMAAAILLTLGRIAWEPSIVGPEQLGKTPLFNALLAGYGIPALLTVAAAYELRLWRDLRIRNLLQGLASLMVLLTLAILVRHAMNGGVLDDTVPTLGEQSIYTLLVIGLSGTLMTLDLRSPSPVFRIGSMIAGGVSMAAVLIAHFIVLNPYFTGESTGAWPFFNLLLIGYLLPGLGYAGLAWYAQGKRPQLYVTLLALAGSALGFAWATLSVRRFWQGADIASWKGFLQGETYSYSVVWLLIGVGLLALGSRFKARSLRLGSAALVLIAVLKVFVVDMANLEGILRALSFIGLGAVLIGIGLFYQKILAGSGKAAPGPAPVETPIDKPE